MLIENVFSFVTSDSNSFQHRCVAHFSVNNAIEQSSEL
jgi:hypothetical protein